MSAGWSGPQARFRTTAGEGTDGVGSAGAAPAANGGSGTRKFPAYAR